MSIMTVGRSLWARKGSGLVGRSHDGPLVSGKGRVTPRVPSEGSTGVGGGVGVGRCVE